MSKNITLKINNAKETVETVQFQTASGEVLRIPAQAKVNYQFIDEATQFGPENIMTKRVGDNLEVAFEGSDISNPDLIIEGYYSSETDASKSSLLIGQHENGGMYPYVPESAEPADAVTMLAEEVEAGQALGGEIINSLWAPNPLWLLALLPLGAAAAALAKNDDDDKDNKAFITVDAPNDPSNAKPTITGTVDDVEPGQVVTLTITDSNGDTQIVTTTVQEDSTYSVEVPNELPDGPYRVDAVVADKAGNVAKASDSSVIDAVVSLTVDAPDEVSTDNTPEITGTSDAIGQIVTLTITDSEGVTHTLTVPVNEEGEYFIQVPDELPDGKYTVEATVSNPAGKTATATDEGEIDTTAVITVDAPDLTNDNTPLITGTTTDVEEGQVVTLTITDANGETQVVTTTVKADGTYEVEVPNELPDGNYTVDAKVTDKAGNEAEARDDNGGKGNVIDTTAPVITVDVPETGNDTTPTITGTTDAPEGSIVTLTVTDANGETQVVTTTVKADGTYEVDVPNELPEGEVSVVAEVEDEAGNKGTAEDKGIIDTTAPVITVDVPDNSNNTTPTITGTTDEPEGTVVTVTVTDANGDTQVVTTTVKDDGTFEVEVPEELPEGPVKVTAEVEDPAGNKGKADDEGTVDTTAPAITVDAPDNSNDNTPTITGTTDAPEGSVVTLTVTDAAGETQVVTTTVKADGTYEADVPAELADGDYEVVAEVTDEAGNKATATDTGSVDTTAAITVEAPDLSNDNTPLITGTTTDVEEGQVVTLTITDANGETQVVTTTVKADGTYEVEVPNELPDGNYTVDAKVTDKAGNEAEARDDNGGKGNVIDTTAPVITVDVPETGNDTTPTITGTTDAPEGSIVTLTVTDANGETQVVTTTVKADGTYEVDVPNELPEGEVSVVAEVEDEAGNKGTAEDKGIIDTTAPVITVDVPDNSNNTTPTITGTTDEPEGTVVTVTVTDANGDTQVVTTTVKADGTYEVDVPNELPEGEVSVVAEVEDEAGNKGTAEDKGIIDTTAPVITVDVPDNSNNTTPTITGTTDEPEGTVVTVTVTDANGDTQVVTTTVKDDDTFEVEVPEELPEGPVKVTAEVEDPAGNKGKADDEGTVDTTAPAITVDAPDNSNDNTPTITGTTDAPEGSVVTLTVTDAAGETQVVTTTVKADGTYEADVPAELADGDYEVVAEVTDEAGNKATATDTGSVDTTAAITVEAPDLSNDNTPLITGTTTDVEEGQVVTLTITDANGETQVVTTTVKADGTYEVEVPNELPDGNYTVDAKVTDKAGNEAEARDDNGVIDATAPVVEAEDNAIEEASAAVVTGVIKVTDQSVASITVGGKDVMNASESNPVVIATKLGTLAITGYDAVKGEVSYRYTENGKAEDHSAGDDSVKDSFLVVVRDAAGNTAMDSLDIQITDTAPVAVDDVNSIDEKGGAVSGNVLDNDSLGADTPVSVAVDHNVGQYGLLTMGDNGEYTYTLNPNSPAVKALNTGDTLQETFTYTVTDADGDKSTATLTITINGQDADKSVIGNNGSNTIKGGTGNDVLIGDTGGYELIIRGLGSKNIKLGYFEASSLIFYLNLHAGG
ncbi:Ig-like domain-containing protein [Neisseria brasiliensis]|nr:Ig-like domain-containing protein [Neisseria brasiliensis]